MEFRCRLGTAVGGDHRGRVRRPERSATSGGSSRTRGCTCCHCARGAASPGWSAGGRRRRSRATSSWSSTRSWRRCSRPACRSCSRSTSCASALTNPVFKAVLDDVHEKVRGGTALSDAFDAHGDLFPCVYTASLMAGERSGNLDAVLRRFVALREDRRHGARTDHLGDDLSGRSWSRCRSCWSASSSSRSCRRSPSSTRSFGAELPLVTRIIVGVSDFVAQQPACSSWSRWPSVAGVGFVVGPPAGPAARVRSLAAALPCVGADRPQVRDLADGAHAGDAARRRHPAGQRARDRRALDRQSIPRRPSSSVVAQRVREGQSFAATLLERARRAGRRDQDDRSRRVDRRAARRCSTASPTSTTRKSRPRSARFVTLIEPALLVVMGVVIAGIVLALYLPLFQLTSVMGR